MAISDLFSDLYAAFSFTEAHAEAPPSDDKDEEETSDEGKKEGGSEESGEKEDGGEDDKAGDEQEEDGDEDKPEEEEEEEEEEEDEPVDPKPQLEEECAKSAQCAPAKHHFDECVERVTAQNEDEGHKGPKEDCVEEFFHLQHCATQCAAPKLWKQLK